MKTDAEIEQDINNKFNAYCQKYHPSIWAQKEFNHEAERKFYDLKLTFLAGFRCGVEALDLSALRTASGNN